MEHDETGEVALMVNRMAGETQSRYGAFPGVDLDRWRTLTPDWRHSVAEGWINACVEEDRILRVELARDDWAQTAENKAG